MSWCQANGTADYHTNYHCSYFFSCYVCYVLGGTEKIILTGRNQESLITVIFIERFKGCMSKGTDI